MNIKKFSLFAVFSLFAILTISLVSLGSTKAVTENINNISSPILNEVDEFGLLNMPGEVSGISNKFEIKDSKYLNITVDSSEIIYAYIESIPHMILMHIEPSDESIAVFTEITISNLEPNTTYYWHQDTHRSMTPFTTDLIGSYTYTQDISESHLVFIKPEPSTKYITDNSTGGDCTTIGTWNNTTKTCTLTTNLTETVEIEDDGITLDGNGYTITGSSSSWSSPTSGTGMGVYLNANVNVTIKNININTFSHGIYLRQSSSSNLVDNNLYNNWCGICLYYSDSNNLTTNNSSNNSYGIQLTGGSTNTLTDNIVNSNTYVGVIIESNTSASLAGNTSNGSKEGIVIGYSSQTSLSDNTMSNNDLNFILVGSDDAHYIDNTIDTSNLVDGKPIYYIKNAIGTTYDNSHNIGTFYCVVCTGVTIEDATLDSNGFAITFWKTNNSRIENISIRGGLGISLLYSNNNIIDSNVIFPKVNAPGPGKQKGIWLNNSHLNVISNNEIDGYMSNMAIHFSNNNSLFNNAISNAIIHGVDLYGSNNEIYNNNFINNWNQISIGGSNNIFHKPLPIGGNYWSDFNTPSEGCSDINGDNICDTPYTFSGGQDNFPWTVQDGWLGIIPSILNLKQYKSDLSTEIDEGGITTESFGGDNITPADPSKSIVAFKAEISDPQDDPVKLQVEVKPFSEPLDGTNFVESDLTTSGSTISVKSDLLAPGQYHWQARVVDVHGNASAWQEFETAGNVDFEVKLVPLYTQNLSQYPSEFDTNSWRAQQYAAGNSNCGFDIQSCGCTITSAVMVMRYHGITTAQSNNVDPLKLNNWLNSNDGYTAGGSLWMGKVAEYSAYLVDYDYDNHGNIDNGDGEGEYRYADLDEALVELDDYLADNNPAILYARPGRGGINRQHYFIADNKLATTYNIKDPYWYNTNKLNEITNASGFVRGYENGFDGLRLFYPSNGSISSANASFALSSPAEFLITDPNGDRIGIDPATGIKYSEISGASYSKEGIDNPNESVASTNHQDKIVHIPNPLDGDYEIKIIGTGEGGYTLMSSVYDSSGDAYSETLQGNIINGLTTEYTFEFDDLTPTNIDISPNDITAPTTSISITGTQISGWYTSNVEVTLSATDNTGGVGVWKTEYSLDGGTTWTTYTDPFTPPDASNLNILYRSEDYVGNVETYSTTTIDIDQSAPEAEIYFNLVNEEVVVNGSDNLSTPTVTKIDEENYTITDHVGHTLKVNLLPTQTSPTLTDPGIVNIKLVSLQYNANDPVLLPTTDLTYEYGVTPTVSLNESITSLPHLSVMGVYNPTDDTTTITGFQNTSTIAETLSGVKILKLQTNKANLEVEY